MVKLVSSQVSAFFEEYRIQEESWITHILKMELENSSKSSLIIYPLAQHSILEDVSHHQHGCDTLRPGKTTTVANWALKCSVLYFGTNNYASPL
jgi:hypothetical protein